MVFDLFKQKQKTKQYIENYLKDFGEVNVYYDEHIGCNIYIDIFDGKKINNRSVVNNKLEPIVKHENIIGYWADKGEWDLFSIKIKNKDIIFKSELYAIHELYRGNFHIISLYLDKLITDLNLK